MGEFDDAVVTLDRDPATGQLTFVEWLHDSQGGVDGLNYAWGVAVSPEGNQVYVAGHNDHSLTQFNRDAATGQLTYVQTHYDNVAGVDGLAVGGGRGDQRGWKTPLRDRLQPTRPSPCSNGTFLPAN